MVIVLNFENYVLPETISSVSSDHKSHTQDIVRRNI